MYTPLDYNSTFSFEDDKVAHLVEQNPIAVWEQMQFHFSKNGLRNAMAAEGADLSSLAMQVSKVSIVGVEAPCPKNTWDTNFYIPAKIYDNEMAYHAWQKRVYEICTDVETVRLTYGGVTMTIKRYSKEGMPFGYYELNPCEQLTKAAHNAERGIPHPAHILQGRGARLRNLFEKRCRRQVFPRERNRRTPL